MCRSLRKVTCAYAPCSRQPPARMAPPPDVTKPLPGSRWAALLREGAQRSAAKAAKRTGKVRTEGREAKRAAASAASSDPANRGGLARFPGVFPVSRMLRTEAEIVGGLRGWWVPPRK